MRQIRSMRRSVTGQKGGMISRSKQRTGRKGGRARRVIAGRKGGGVRRKATETFRQDIMTAIERFTDRLVGRKRLKR